MTRIGIISDTHSLLRDEAVEALANVDLIIHAGDIGSADVIDRLADLAPVKAVRGNIDKSPWADRFPITDAFEVDGTFFYLIHEISQIDIDPDAGGFDVVIHGHSHKPTAEIHSNVLYLNPGSAGPVRFNLPVCLSTLELQDGIVIPTRIDL